MTATAQQSTVVDHHTGEVLPVSRGDSLFVAMSSVKAVAKDSKGMGYQYRGIEAIMQAARPALKAANMSCRPVNIELLEREVRPSARGSALIYTMVRVTFRYASSSDFFDVQVIGEAFDSGDKGMSKAISVAQRTAHILALQIPTGEDTEEGEQHEPAALAEVADDAELAVDLETRVASMKLSATGRAVANDLLECLTIDAMKSLAPRIKALTAEEIEVVRPIYKEHKNTIEKANTQR